MKKILTLFAIILLSKPVFSQLVKENLFALPSYTYTNFSGVSSPNIGSLVYNLTDNKLYFYNGSLWVLLDTDTAALSNRINLRLRYIDTSAMLSKYINFANNGLVKSAQNLQLGGALIQATSLTTSGVNTLALNGLTSGSKSNDSLMVAVASSGIIKRISPSSLLNGYMKYTDTASLSNRIDKRVRYTDTSSMLTPYLRKGDTANMLSKYIYNSNNGLTKNGKTVQLGGTLTQATTITTSSTNTLTLAGLQRAASTDSVLMVTSAGVVKRITSANLHTGYMKYTDTASLSNRIDKRVRYTDTATMLTPYLRKGDTSAMLSKYLRKGDTSNMLSKYLRKGDTANMLSKYIYNANNGLAKNGKTVQLGGTLTQATTITTSSTNTLALAGLQGGNSNDSLLVQNPSTNAIRRTVFPKTQVFLTTTTQANSSNTTFANINSLQFSYVSGKKYKVKVYLVYNAAATTTGIQLGPNSVTGNIWYSTLVNITTTTNQQLSGYNATTVLVSGSSRATTANVALFECTLEATGSATFSLQFASEVNGSAITIQSNSRMEVEEIL